MRKLIERKIIKNKLSFFGIEFYIIFRRFFNLSFYLMYKKYMLTGKLTLMYVK